MRFSPIIVAILGVAGLATAVPAAAETALARPVAVGATTIATPDAGTSADQYRGWRGDRGWRGGRGWRGDRGWHRGYGWRGGRGWRGDRYRRSYYRQYRGWRGGRVVCRYRYGYRRCYRV